MKKLIAVVLAVTLLASLSGLAASCAYSDLMRDGGDSQELVGGVGIWDDNVSTLFVDFVVPHGYADDNWCIAEAHLHIFTDNVTFDDIKLTGGGPPPGKFKYKRYYDNPCDDGECYTGWDEVEELGDPEFGVPWPDGAVSGDIVYIALHLELVRWVDDTCIRETAWIVGNDFPGKNWAMYFPYELGSEQGPVPVI